MKIFPLLPLALAAAAMCFTGGCKKADNSELAHHHHHGHEGHDEHDHEGHDHEHEGHSHDHDHEGHNHEHEGHGNESHENHGEGVITLSPEQAELFHVTASPAQLMSIGNVIKVGGTLTASTDGNAIVSAPIAGVVTYTAGINAGSEVHAGTTVATVKAGVVSGSGANEVARAELEAARAELDRLKPLYEKRLVTQARYNEAVAAYERAKAAYSAPAAGGRATSPISGVIVSVDAASGAFVEAGAPLATVASASGLTLRAYVPVRYSSSLADIVDARIVDPSNGHSITISSAGGRRLSNSQAAASAGYIPVTFSVPNDGTLVPGTAVEVYLIGKGDKTELTVPASAIYEQQGDYCVFVKLDEDCYRKMPVTVGSSDGKYVVILSGLHEGDMVVDSGVTTVRLAGASGSVPAGHSHSH